MSDPVLFPKKIFASLENLLDNDYTDEVILSKVHRRCKASPEDILSAVDGTDLNPHQKARINIVKKHMEYVDSLLDEIQRHINEMIAGYKNYIQLLCTIPDIDRNLPLSLFLKLALICLNGHHIEN